MKSEVGVVEMVLIRVVVLIEGVGGRVVLI